MMKNILFLVTGMTPQIITETVWALACDPQREEKWIPEEIHILTTAHGANLINARLLEKGVFEQFKKDYQLDDMKFYKNFINIVENNHEKLSDLKTPLDNEKTADLICQTVRDFTNDDNVCLHVSIAGGRKTMGFYAGYALSLYGRSQDRMSHILVESDFENVPDFYYPTPYDKEIITDKGIKLNAKNAKVWLADIPFVRMRGAIIDKHALKGKDSFSQVVEKINLSFQDPQLKIDVLNKTILINNSILIDDLDPKCFAFLYWFADLRKNGKNGIIAPKKWDKANQAEKRVIDELTLEYAKYYEKIKNINVSDKRDVDFYFRIDADFYMDKIIFESTKSNLLTALKEQLSTELAKRFEIIQDKRREPFYLNIDPKNIEILDSFCDNKGSQK